jgi:hypothetical protein
VGYIVTCHRFFAGDLTYFRHCFASAIGATPSGDRF